MVSIAPKRRSMMEDEEKLLSAQKQSQRKGAVARGSQYSSSAGGYQVVADLCFSPNNAKPRKDEPDVPGSVPGTPSSERIIDYIQAGYHSPEITNMRSAGAIGHGAAMEALEPSSVSMGAQQSALSYHLSVGGASSSSRGRGEQQQVHSSGSPEWEECFMVSFDVNLWEWKERKDLICLQTREGLDLEGRSVGRCAAGVPLPLRTDWNVFLMQDSNMQPGAPPRSLIVTSNKQIHQRLSSQAERSATAMFFADEFNATFNPRFPVKFQEFMAVQLSARPGTPLGYAMDLVQDEDMSKREVEERKEQMIVFEMFTFMRSKGCLVITGAVMSGHKWTQPVLHSLNREYGETDRGQDGIIEFAIRHKLLEGSGVSIGHQL